MTDRQRLRVVVYGYVQGVGFRAYVAGHMRRLGLTGWVRNRWDGAVEVVVEGPRSLLEQALRLIQRGPSEAEVEQSEVSWLPATGEFHDFRIAF